MLTNVLADRKNMLYEELLAARPVPTDARDAVASTPILPRSSVWSEVRWYITILPEAVKTLDGRRRPVARSRHLLKCGYGNSQHIQENPEEYTSYHAPSVRRKIFKMYRDLNRMWEEWRWF